MKEVVVQLGRVYERMAIAGGESCPSMAQITRQLEQLMEEVREAKEDIAAILPAEEAPLF